MPENMKIEIPEEARVGNEEFGDLTPAESFYTLPCVKDLPNLGASMTYEFNGKDFGFEYGILVGTSEIILKKPPKSSESSKPSKPSYSLKLSHKMKKILNKYSENGFVVYECDVMPEDDVRKASALITEGQKIET